MKFYFAGLTAALLLMATPAAHANLISNGKFGTGDFTGWTLAPYGANGGTGNGGFPIVSSFDVTGSGAQNAATFNVGLASGPYGGSAVGGVTLSQMFTTTGGVVDFSAAIAVSGSNFNLGEYVVLIDGTQIASYSFGSGSGTDRSSLFGTDVLSAGLHDLQIEIFRNYYSCGYSCTPNQYITNINLTGAAAVPEPVTISLFGVGLVGAAALRRRRQSKQAV